MNTTTARVDVPTGSYGELEAGCWFDSSRGSYLGDAVISLAMEHGWLCALEGADAGPYQDSPTWSHYEDYPDRWTEAEDYMAQFAAEGYWFGPGESGDWGLWSIDDDSFGGC